MPGAAPHKPASPQNISSRPQPSATSLARNRTGPEIAEALSGRSSRTCMRHSKRIVLQPTGIRTDPFPVVRDRLAGPETDSLRLTIVFLLSFVRRLSPFGRQIMKLRPFTRHSCLPGLEWLVQQFTNLAQQLRQVQRLLHERADAAASAGKSWFGRAVIMMTANEGILALRRSKISQPFFIGTFRSSSRSEEHTSE